MMMRGINHQNIFEDEEDNWQFINTLDRMRMRTDDNGQKWSLRLKNCNVCKGMQCL